MESEVDMECPERSSTNTNQNRKRGEKEVSSKTIRRGWESDDPRSMKEENDHAHAQFASFLRLSRANLVFRSDEALIFGHYKRWHISKFPR